VLYYGDTAGNNVKASQYVTDLTSDEQLAAFITSQPDRVLTVVNVSLLSAAPCVHIFPAVLALATNFQGYAAFARLLGDDQPELLKKLDVTQVPTFIFYRNGEEVGRHVGSSRGDLIGQILAQQARRLGWGRRGRKERRAAACFRAECMPDPGALALALHAQ
ncbi:hypothetical protein COHA_009727, partial [Chlorella ohadii]